VIHELTPTALEQFGIADDGRLLLTMTVAVKS
jgi:hypothetical protein